jgi:hypothetical protein
MKKTVHLFFMALFYCASVMAMETKDPLLLHGLAQINKIVVPNQELERAYREIEGSFKSLPMTDSYDCYEQSTKLHEQMQNTYEQLERSALDMEK